MTVYTNSSYENRRATSITALDISHSEQGRFASNAKGVKMFRLGSGCIYFWDRHNKTEIPITLDWLVSACQ